MEVISEFIDSTPYLSDLQRAFYKHYIKARYNLILVPAFDLADSLEQEPNKPIMGM